MEFYDSMIASGAQRAQRARIAVVPAQHSWVALPGPLVSNLLDSGAELPVAIRLNIIPASAFAQRISGRNPHQQQQQLNPTSPRYVAWAGAVSAAAGTIELAAGLASALQLPAGAEVAVELLPGLAAAAAVVVEPVSAADWEVVELNAGLLEELLLNQAGVVCVGQPFPLWARQARVLLRITSIMHWPDTAAAASGSSSSRHLVMKHVAKLAHGTELHIAPKPRVQNGSSLKPGQLPLAGSSSSSGGGGSKEQQQQQQQQEPGKQQQQQQHREAVWLRVQDAGRKHLLNTADLQQQQQQHIHHQHCGSCSGVHGSGLGMNGANQQQPAKPANGSGNSGYGHSGNSNRQQSSSPPPAAAAANVTSWVTTAVFVSPATAQDLNLTPGELVKVLAGSIAPNPRNGSSSSNPSVLPLQSIVLLLQLDADVAWGHVAVAPPLQQCLAVAADQYIKLQTVQQAVHVLQQLPGLVLHPLLPVDRAGAAGSTIAASGSTTAGSTAGLVNAVTSAAAAAAVVPGSTIRNGAGASRTARCSISEIEELPDEAPAGIANQQAQTNNKQQRQQRSPWQQQQRDSFTGIGLVQEAVAEILSKPLELLAKFNSKQQQPGQGLTQPHRGQQLQQQQLTHVQPAAAVSAAGEHQLLLQQEIAAAAVHAWLQLQALAAAAAAGKQAPPAASAAAEEVMLPCCGPLLVHFSLQQQQHQAQEHTTASSGASSSSRDAHQEPQQQQQQRQEYLLLLLPHHQSGAASSKDAFGSLNTSSSSSSSSSSAGSSCYLLPTSLLQLSKGGSSSSSSSNHAHQQQQLNVHIAGALLYDPGTTTVPSSAAAAAHSAYVTHVFATAETPSSSHLSPDSYPWLNPALQSCLARLNPRLSLLSWQAWQSVQLPLPGGVLFVGGSDGGRGWLLQLLGQAAAAEHAVHTLKVSCKGLAGQSYDAAVRVLAAAAAEVVCCCPGLLLLDDLDMLTPAANGEGPQADQQDHTTATRLSEWLSELMRWAAQQPRPISFAATCSAAAALPAALRAAGCFDYEVKVPPFGVQGRAALLLAGFKAKGLGFSGGVEEIEGFAGKQLEGFDARDLQLVVDRAVHAALRRQTTQNNTENNTTIDSGGQQQGFGVECRQAFEVTAADVAEGLAGFIPAAFWRAGQQKQQQSSAGAVQGWEDVGGLAAAVAALHEALVIPAKYGRLLAAAPLRLRAGLLLFGPPGCGKTHVVAAAVAATGARLISVKGPELLNKYIGQSEAAVRDLFVRAAAAAPCVLFFDEFDAIAPPRGHDSTGVTDRVVNQLLTELDGVEGLTGVSVLAATSRPDLIDAALLRPGRLDRMVYCGFPDEPDRLSILTACARKLPLAPGVNFAAIAARTVNFTGADLSAILSEAQLLAVHEQLDNALLQRKNAVVLIDNTAQTDDSSGGGGVQQGSSSSSSSSSEKDISSAAAGGVPVVTMQHLERALARARPSLPLTEQRRLAAVYARFQQGRDPGISNRQVLDEQQQRVKHATLA